ncbi:MAG TPA: TerC family protein [Bacilli bacterium]|nr:TerC family protein [Bacilli bacterium]
MSETLLAIEILLISAILSVDNALVIGLATRHLPEGIRQKAIFWGTMGAVGLRIALSMLAVFLINTPYLKLIGGVFLLYLAFKMLGDEDEMKNLRQGKGLVAAIQVIVLADLMVSVDNVLAIVGISDGNWLLLALGILVSIPCILWGSKLISHLLHRYPVLMFAGVAVLAWTGSTMILEEQVIASFVEPLGIPNGAFHVISVAATTAASFVSKRFA